MSTREERDAMRRLAIESSDALDTWLVRLSEAYMRSIIGTCIDSDEYKEHNEIAIDSLRIRSKFYWLINDAKMLRNKEKQK